MIDWETHLPTLECLKGEGKIGMVGVSAMVPEAYPTIMGLMRAGPSGHRPDPLQRAEPSCCRTNCCPWPRNWALASW